MESEKEWNGESKWVSFEETVLKIKQRFCISETDAREIVRKYWL